MDLNLHTFDDTDLPFAGQGFRRVSDRVKEERDLRRGLKAKLLSFGIRFLDMSLRGILPDDLILVGAPSGVGKTQFCVNVALANLEEGKRVHFIALEASELEIERRLKYSILADAFYSDPERPRIGRPLNFIDWILGDFDQILEPYESVASRLMEGYSQFFTFYKNKQFGISQLEENLMSIAHETDLILVDHVHYFDLDDDNENRAMKQIAKSAREICQVIQKPMILVAHLRKKDRKGAELIPGMDEFHGSSDLTKIATKVITLAPGQSAGEGRYETYFRIPKNRVDGGTTRFVAKLIYDSKLNAYEQKFQIGKLVNGATEFQALEIQDLPFWLHDANVTGGAPAMPKPAIVRKPVINYAERLGERGD